MVKCLLLGGPQDGRIVEIKDDMTRIVMRAKSDKESFGLLDAIVKYRIPETFEYEVHVIGAHRVATYDTESEVQPKEPNDIVSTLFESYSAGAKVFHQLMEVEEQYAVAVQFNQKLVQEVAELHIMLQNTPAIVIPGQKPH